MPNREKSQENKVFGNLEQAISEGFTPRLDQPIQVVEIEMKPTDADHPSPIVVLVAVWKADLPSPIIFISRSPC